MTARRPATRAERRTPAPVAPGAGVRCVCGAPNVTHRTDGPCFVTPAPPPPAAPAMPSREEVARVIGPIFDYEWDSGRPEQAADAVLALLARPATNEGSAT